jgi:hypothetical protein
MRMLPVRTSSTNARTCSVEIGGSKRFIAPAFGCRLFRPAAIVEK